MRTHLFIVALSATVVSGCGDRPAPFAPDAVAAQPQPAVLQLPADEAMAIASALHDARTRVLAGLAASSDIDLNSIDAALAALEDAFADADVAQFTRTLERAERALLVLGKIDETDADGAAIAGLLLLLRDRTGVTQRN